MECTFEGYSGSEREDRCSNVGGRFEEGQVRTNGPSSSTWPGKREALGKGDLDGDLGTTEGMLDSFQKRK